VLVESLKKAYDSFWPKGPLDALSELPHMINVRHYERTQSLLKETNGKIEFGGAGEGLRIEPAIVTNVKLDDPLLKESVMHSALPELIT